ncbi:Ankyrin repeat-containing protein [Colletotrichum asianum]
MAKALGTVASVIAVVDLAGKAVTVSFKLKSLWDEVKDLPDTLLEKAEELQDLDDFLRDAESNAANSPLPNLNAISKARAAMEDFQRTLDIHIHSLADKRRRKKKLAAAKIVFQKGSLEAMERKLDRALRLFKMAQNQYCV